MKRHQELNKLILPAQESKQDNESLIKATIGHFTKDYKVKLLQMVKVFKKTQDVDELENAMISCGCAKVDDISAELLRLPE